MAKRRRVQVIEIQHVDIGPIGTPVDAVIKLRLDGAKKGYVFAIKRSTREKMEDEHFMKSAQSLGDLVHPHPAVMLVLPDEAMDLRAYVVVAK